MSASNTITPSAAPQAPAPQRRLSAIAAALTGILALVAALAAGHLVAGFIDADASPFVAVGNSAIDLTPIELKDFAVRNFGTYDKLVLKGGMGIVLLIVSALAGLISRRSRYPGLVIVALFGVIGIVAVSGRPNLGTVALLAPLASLLAGIGVFLLLHRLCPRYALVPKKKAATAADATDIEPPATDQPAPAVGDGPGPSRRTALIAGAGVVAGAVVATVGGELLGELQASNAASSRATVGKLVPATRAPAIPAGADFAQFGTPKFLTQNRDFYRVDTALSVPQVTLSDWSLRLHGMVNKEITFDFNDIRSRALVERTITMTCVSNEVGGTYVSTSNFIGVDLGELLREAGIRPGAEQLFSTSVDGWTSGSPVAAAMDPRRGAMLAIGMNGEPLPAEHGFPARLVIPGLYGYVSATKWVTDLEVTTWAAKQAYWLKRGWSQQAPIKTESRIDSPRGFDTVSGSPTRISGIAWAQHTGLRKVEVQIDEGPWQLATLTREVNLNTWRMWTFDAKLEPGVHTAVCRATDASGYTQTNQRAGTVPDGATGWHSITFTTT